MATEIFTGQYDSSGGMIFTNGSSCYVYYDPSDPNQGWYYVGCPTANTGLPPAITPTYPAGGGGVYIQPGGSWLNDILNTFLGATALEQRGTIGASGVNQNQQVRYPNTYLGQVPVGGVPVSGGVGTIAGASVGSFLQNNGFLLLIGVGVFLLYKSGRK